MPASATIALVGDLMLGRLVSQTLARRTPQSIWGDVQPLLLSADGVIANLECAITLSRRPWMRSEKCFHFRADPAAVPVLRAGNIRAVCLANNHVLDFETVGLEDTLRLLDDAGIAHMGAGTTADRAFAPALAEMGGLRLALFGVTDNEPAFAAAPDSAGVAYVNLDEPLEQLRPCEAEIAAARRAGAEIVVISCHLGPNMVTRPAPAIRAYHRALIDRGADIVHGHSAHLFQGVERHGRGLILHDAGDFLDDYAIDPELRNDWTFLFRVELTARGLDRLTLVPVLLRCAGMGLAPSDERAAMEVRMRELSGELGVDLQACAEGLWARLS